MIENYVLSQLHLFNEIDSTELLKTAVRQLIILLTEKSSSETPLSSVMEGRKRFKSGIYLFAFIISSMGCDNHLPCDPSTGLSPV